MPVYTILELHSFILILASHAKLNFFLKYALYSGTIFKIICSTFFYSVFLIKPIFYLLYFSLSVPKILFLQLFGGLNRLFKLTGNCLCILVYIIILALLQPTVIQCGIMAKINCKLKVVFDGEIFIIVIR